MKHAMSSPGRSNLAAETKSWNTRLGHYCSKDHWEAISSACAAHASLYVFPVSSRHTELEAWDKPFVSPAGRLQAAGNTASSPRFPSAEYPKQLSSPNATQRASQTYREKQHLREQIKDGSVEQLAPQTRTAPLLAQHALDEPPQNPGTQTLLSRGEVLDFEERHYSCPCRGPLPRGSALRLLLWGAELCSWARKTV